MDCSLPGSSVHGIFQAILLEWIAISFSRGSSQPRDWTQVSRVETDALLSEPPGKSSCIICLITIPFLEGSEIKPVNPKGSQSWIFMGRTDAEAETPIFWLPDAKNWLIGKDPVAGKDWRQEGKGTTEDEVVGWHHWPDGHEFEQALGVGDGQGSLACCSPWGCRVGHNWETELTEGYMSIAVIAAYSALTVC